MSTMYFAFIMPEPIRFGVSRFRMEGREESVEPEPTPTPEPEDENIHPMDALLEEADYELEAPRRGEIRTGKIARVTESDIFVDIGAKSEGIISPREVEQLTEEQRAELALGTEISVYVVRGGFRGGSLELSLERAEEEMDWQKAEELLRSKEIHEGEITGYNKGGLIVKLGQLRGFIPASQVSLARRRRADGDTPDKRWGNMVGESVVCRVIEVDRRRNRLILSERAAAREAREALKERLISELTPGEVRTGHVISLADFGAFVDIGGADGLVHISEISWKRVANPREVLKVGQEVQVKVLGVDPERNRISLSLRDLEPNPWQRVRDECKEGQLVEGVVTKLTKFGAFAQLAGLEDYGIEGLIHISELSDQRIEHPGEVVQEGQTLTLRVLKVDTERRRIGLSLRRVAADEYRELDLQTALEQTSIEEAAVEDFDAELEAEAALNDDLDAEPETEPSDLDLDAEADLTEVEPDAEADLTEAEPDAEAEPTEVELEAEAEAEQTEAELEAGTESELAAEFEAQAESGSVEVEDEPAEVLDASETGEDSAELLDQDEESVSEIDRTSEGGGEAEPEGPEEEAQE